MLFVISPAKSLDLSAETRYTANHSTPHHLDATEELVGVLQQMDAPALGKLMHISDNLAALNYHRYQDFSLPFRPDNAKQALLCFNGDVYQSFELDTYGEAEFGYAQEHLRILSGLYGLLRPLDLIQPYRLEMGTKLATDHGASLYEFWGDRLTEALKAELHEFKRPVLINLASNEYFKSLQPKLLDAPVITPQFKDYRDGKLKTLGLFAKRARGAMVDYAIKEKCQSPEDLKAFVGMGYQYDESLSSETEWVFTR